MNAPRPGGYCTECGHEVESFDGLDACPVCGTRGIPCSWSDEVAVTINWHQLRCLIMWAENWARNTDEPSARSGMRKVLNGIVGKIERQHPEEWRAPLTFAKEIGLLAAEFDVSVTDPRLRQDVAEQTGREVGLSQPKEEGEEWKQ